VSQELVAYAEAHAQRRGPTCQACAISTGLLDEMRAARKADPIRYTFPMLAGYLRDRHGLKVSPGTLARHWRDHERA
jgi:hypothetical protein